MFLSNGDGVEHSGSGVKRIDGRVNTEFSKTSVKHSSSVKMCECSSRSGIGQIIGRHVNSLHGSNGTLLSGGNSLLKSTQIGSQGRLITDGRGNTSQKCGHFRASLSESENVVDEEQHVLAFFVSEVLRHSETGEADSGSGTWGFVHLTEDECASGFIVVETDDVGRNHFVVEIVTFSGSFSDTGEHGVTTVVLSDVVDEFLNEHSLADTCTTEQTDLTTSSVGGQEIDDLDTSDQNFSRGSLIGERRGVSVDGVVFSGLDGSSLIDGLTYCLN